MRAARVRTPATTANLGPGFDSFGLALALYDSFAAEPADVWSVHVAGSGEGELSLGEDNAVVRAMKLVLAEAGAQDACFAVSCENGIPQGMGLGSSAAAVVGGLLLADTAVEFGLPRTRLFEIASQVEGHPDNAAAALFGGLTVCWTEGETRRYSRLEPAGGLAAVVVPAAEPLPTSDSRALLPAEVPLADAAANAAAASLLIAGLTLGRPELLRAGLTDRIHEPYRRRAVPDLERVRDLLIEAGCDGAALSGAGPSVVGLVHARDDERALRSAREVAARAAVALIGVDGRDEPLALGVARAGAEAL